MAAPRTHFISVARNGDLHARRIGAAPVRIAAAGQPLVLTVPGRPELADLRVYFDRAPATPRHHVGDDELGQWMRAAIDRILDLA